MVVGNGSHQCNAANLNEKKPVPVGAELGPVQSQLVIPFPVFFLWKSSLSHPSKTLIPNQNFAKKFLHLSLLENNSCARYRFDLITLGVEKIQQLICYCYKSSK